MKTAKLNIIGQSSKKNTFKEELQYIRLSSENRMFEVTNGHILIRMKFNAALNFELQDSEALCSILNKDIFIHYSEWQKIASKNIVNADVKENYIVFSDNKGSQYFVRFEENVLYPKTDVVFKDEVKETDCIGLNVAYLSDLNEVVKSCYDHDSIGVKFRFTGKNGAVKFSPNYKKDEEPKFYGLIMPIMLDSY